VTRHSAVPPPVTAVLDASSRWLPARMGGVEQMLREQVVGHGEALAGDAASTLEAGGKRLRPMLVLLCAGEAAGEEAVRAATAMRMPSPANARAIARPMPRPPPVIRAVLATDDTD